MTALASALAQGATYAQIGALLGISLDAARMRAKRAGLRPLHRRRQPSADTRRRIAIARAMLAQGCDLADVAERLGMKVPAVRMMLKRAGDA